MTSATRSICVAYHDGCVRLLRRGHGKGSVS
jgi:hypothetical protein